MSELEDFMMSQPKRLSELYFVITLNKGLLSFVEMTRVFMDVAFFGVSSAPI